MKMTLSWRGEASRRDGWGNELGVHPTELSCECKPICCNGNILFNDFQCPPIYNQNNKMTQSLSAFSRERALYCMFSL